MSVPSIAVDDPTRDEVRALLERHLAFCAALSPPEDVHALDVAGLVDPAVTFVSARLGGRVVGVGAVKELNPTHGELKSMHTAAEVRGRGVARAILTTLVSMAQARGYRRLSLETGTPDGFAPARNLYASAGFLPCEPFGDYRPSPYSTFFTLELPPLP